MPNKCFYYFMPLSNISHYFTCSVCRLCPHFYWTDPRCLITLYHTSISQHVLVNSIKKWKLLNEALQLRLSSTAPTLLLHPMALAVVPRHHHIKSHTKNISFTLRALSTQTLLRKVLQHIHAHKSEVTPALRSLLGYGSYLFLFHNFELPQYAQYVASGMSAFLPQVLVTFLHYPGKDVTTTSCLPLSRTCSLRA